MMISVRRADLEVDRDELLKLLQTNLPQLPHQRFFDWLYLDNPEGRALTWVATETHGGRMVGMAAAFPRGGFGFGKEARGYVLGDFCIVPEYRSLGLALTLQRACLADLSEDGAQFALDFPSDGMLAVYRRLRIDSDKTVIRYAKVLRTDRKFGRRVAGRGLAAVANGLLMLRDKRNWRRTPSRIAPEGGPYGEEFTRAALEWTSGTRVCAIRTAEFLNWRYYQHPLWKYEMLTVRGRGALHGYLIQHIHAGDCIVDELMAGDETVRRDLLIESIAIARARGVQTLNVPWLSSHPVRGLLRKCGFRPRESHRVVLLCWPRCESEPGGSNERWYLSCGDWER